MASSSSSSFWIPAPTHHPAAGARPRRLPFHAVFVRPCRSAVSSVSASSPQQAPAPGDSDDANGPTGMPVPFSRPLTSVDHMGKASGEGLRDAYQGCPGAYSEAAAKKAYPSYETVPYEYFETAFQVPSSLPDPHPYHERMTLLRSQGTAEVVIRDPLEQHLLPVDFDGRVTSSIGPLSGGMYYSNFIPYVNSYTEIYMYYSD